MPARNPLARGSPDAAPDASKARAGARWCCRRSCLALLAVETAPRVERPGPPDAAAAALTRELADAAEELVGERGGGGCLERGRGPAERGARGGAAAGAGGARAGAGRGGRAGRRAFGRGAAHAARAVGEPRAGGGGLGRRARASPRRGSGGCRCRRRWRCAALRTGARPGARRGLGTERARAASTACGSSRRGSRSPSTSTGRARGVLRRGCGTRVRRAAGDDGARAASTSSSGTLRQGGARAAPCRAAARCCPTSSAAVRVAARQRSGADRERAAAARSTRWRSTAAIRRFGDGDRGRAATSGCRGRRNGCEQHDAGGRDDLKRHFVVSAGLYAATARCAPPSGSAS